MVKSGALVGELVSQGEWYRLCSALFVHVTTLHLLVNMFSLWSLMVVEKLLGRAVWLVLYLLSGIVGNLFSCLLLPGNDASAGASGAIFGLFGAMLALALLRILPGVVRNQLLLILAVNVVLDVSNHDIDWLAHLGGMLTGILLTIGYVKALRKPLLWRTSAFVLCILTAVCLIFTLFMPIPGI